MFELITPSHIIEVRKGFKTCAYYTNNDVEDVINDI